MAGKSGFRQFYLGFWQAAAVEDLDPIEKLLYVYMITSPKSNMEGVYKTTIRRIAFETGIDRDMIPKMSARFEEAGIGGVIQDNKGNAWVIVSSAPEHMPATEQIKRRFEIQLEEWPEEIIEAMHRVGYRWPEWVENPRVTRPSPDPHPTLTQGSPDPMSTRYDTSTDTIQYNTDTNTKQLPQPSAAAKEPATLSALKDPLANLYQSKFTEQVPGETWGNIGRERKACGTLADHTRKLSDVTDIPAKELVDLVLATYAHLKQTERASFWKTASWTPSALAVNERWNAVVEALRAKYQEKQEAEEMMYVPKF